MEGPCRHYWYELRIHHVNGDYRDLVRFMYLVYYSYTHMYTYFMYIYVCVVGLFSVSSSEDLMK